MRLENKPLEEIRLRLRSDVASFFRLAAKADYRSLNAYLGTMLGGIAYSEQMAIELRWGNGFYTLGNDLDLALFGAFETREEAVKAAQKIINSCLRGSVRLVDHTQPEAPASAKAKEPLPC